MGPMSRWRVSQLRPIALLLASCALALLIGLALFRSDPLAAGSSPTRATAPPVAVATWSATATTAISDAPTATALLAPIAPPTASIALSAAPSATAVRASVTAAPTVAPTPVPRVVIGRWQDHQVLITEAFVARGPWRICWSQPDPAIPFQVMVGDAGQTAWEFYSAPVGATSGHFDLPQSGAYRLMIHGETPYDVIVLDRPAAGDMSSPPAASLRRSY